MTPIWTTQKRKVADLNDWEQNPRKITDEQFMKLKEGIALRGFHDVIKIDTDGTIISGHQRKRALTDLGILEVNVMVPDRPLTDEERHQIAVESNLHRGTFDFDILANHFDTSMLLDMGMNNYELGLSPETEGKQRRIVFTISDEQYQETLNRIDNARNKLGCDTKTDLLLELLSGVES